VQTTTFTLCFSLYLMSGLPLGLTVLDTAGGEWLRFYYEVNIDFYYPGAGFLGNYILSMLR
jgi:hypothetical protein